MVFGDHVAAPMHDDHVESTIAMVEHYVPSLKGNNYAHAAEITSVDSLGMYVKVTRDPENDVQLSGQPKQFKLRQLFPVQAEEHKDVKSVVVQMTQESMQAKEEAEATD